VKPLLFLLLSLPALAAPVDAVLGAREHVITAAEVQSLGANADRLLIGAASDGKASRWRRARALLALQFAPSSESLAFLRFVIDGRREAKAGADVLELAAAVTSLHPYGKEALADLLPLATHASADVRHAVVQSLARIPAPEAESALRARLYVERDAGVRDAVARALKNR
jgi:hypothetical protein